MKTTRYFEKKVRAERAEAREDWCERAVRSPLHTEVQPDGRVRHWVEVVADDGEVRVLRVVTLADHETVHNAFFDRNFRRRHP